MIGGIIPEHTKFIAAFWINEIGSQREIKEKNQLTEHRLLWGLLSRGRLKRVWDTTLPFFKQSLGNLVRVKTDLEKMCSSSRGALQGFPVFLRRSKGFLGPTSFTQLSSPFLRFITLRCIWLSRMSCNGWMLMQTTRDWFPQPLLGFCPPLFLFSFCREPQDLQN